MEEYHQQYCQSHFNYHQSNFQIWNISDIESDMDRRQLRQYSQQVFEIIKQKSKILVSSLL